MNLRLVLLLMLICGLSMGAACSSGSSPKNKAALPAAPEDSGESADLSRFFGDIDGTFVLLETQDDRTLLHNVERARRRYIPASTFKIPNTLIALETGVATGSGFGLDRDPERAPQQDWWPESWTERHTLETALPNSVVWFYKELARRIGPERMRDYVERFDYGKEAISGGIDEFWLTGDLRISAREQVDFLRRFHGEELGVAKRNSDLTKKLLVIEETAEYRLSGKTGLESAREDSPQIGWFVGYVERGGETCFFALNIDVEEAPHIAARTSIARAILSDRGWLEEK